MTSDWLPGCARVPNHRLRPLALFAPRFAAPFIALVLLPLFAASATVRPDPGALDCVASSWASATVLVPAHPDVDVDLRPGDRIAALGPGGLCVGESVWDSTGASITLWADDPDTEPKDGLAEGDPVVFVTYSADDDTPEPVHAMFSFRPLFSPVKGFRPDEVYLVRAAGASEPGQPHAGPANILNPIRPNPVRQDGQVSLSLDAADDVQVDILDALGRRVAVLFSGPLEAGDHTFPLDASGLAEGTYVCWVRSGRRMYQRRFTVAR